MYSVNQDMHHFVLIGTKTSGISAARPCPHHFVSVGIHGDTWVLESEAMSDSRIMERTGATHYLL